MDKVLKFCFITTFYPPYNLGGEGMAIYHLVNLLARKGHLIDVFYCVDAYRVLQKYPLKGDFPNHPNVKIFQLKSRAGILSPLLTQQTGYPFFKRELTRHLEANKYDVIHYHNMSLIGLKALSYGAAVKLYTIHDHWLICPMHALWKFNREVCTKKSCTGCQLAGGKPPQLWRHTKLLENSLRDVDCFIAPSKYVLEKHLESGLQIPIVHIPHFLGLSEDKKDFVSENPNNRPYFLFVGRLNKIKGVQNLIPVFKNLQEYDLLIAGDGEYHETLSKLVDNIPNMKFLGGVSRQKLKNLYKYAIAVIVPSVCPETFGLITIEAFSVRTPVIANNLGALPEIIEQSEAGFIYNDQTELIKAIQSLGQNSELRDKLGQRGYEALLKYWSEEAYLTQYLSLIENLYNKNEGELQQALKNQSL